MPRYVEIFFESFLYPFVLSCLYYFPDGIWYFASVLYTLLGFSMFVLYKNFVTFSPVNIVQIDYEKEEIFFEYWLFYLIHKKRTIKFDELSLIIRDDVLLFGLSTSIRIFQNDKYKIKLNPRFGWKETQVEEMLSIFLTITKNEVRKKVPWYIKITGTKNDNV